LKGVQRRGPEGLHDTSEAAPREKALATRQAPPRSAEARTLPYLSLCQSWRHHTGRPPELRGPAVAARRNGARIRSPGRPSRVTRRSLDRPWYSRPTPAATSALQRG
jgi:hypothetical protein